ncbi:hypothetical protein Naga_100547g2 [Nannochloropsis gaditana]|uniref:GCK domain-containing protein n=1 Tax=Nannochloropsis gaditana TaxID=72520 RepID=W7TBP0_9STRA|nr:hypothetical protein Naga_100547g2 [Nannochloropsis gaditana]
MFICLSRALTVSCPFAVCIPTSATSPSMETQYDRVPLAFLDEDSCPLCKMMKTSPCNDIFRRFHQCVEWHTQRGYKDLATPCGPYALALNKCIRANALVFPAEILQQTWDQQGFST